MAGMSWACELTRDAEKDLRDLPRVMRLGCEATDPAYITNRSLTVAAL
jgi:hypothetical protein